MATRKVAAAGSPVTKHAAKSTTPAKKDKQDKLVRDSFTIPKGEYAAIADLKQRAARLGRAAKKSELLRAGIAMLKSLSDAALQSALAVVPSIKTGRPKKADKAAGKGAAKVGAKSPVTKHAVAKPAAKKATAKKPAVKKAAAKKPAAKKAAVKKSTAAGA